MSILIHGVSMPKDERAIHLEIHSDGTVLMWQMGDDDKVVGTAIELPPHGRLGDLDALAAKDTAEYEEAMNFAIDLSTRTLFDCTHREVQKAIKNAPTIIPADPEEGGTSE